MVILGYAQTAYCQENEKNLVDSVSVTDSIVENKEVIVEKTEAEPKQLAHPNALDLGYPWQTLKGKTLTFLIKESTDEEQMLGFQYFYTRKDLQVPYASSDNLKTRPTEMIGKRFKVLNVFENIRNRESGLGVLIFLENLKPSSFLYKQLYYFYIPGSQQAFMFEIPD
ncbi:hypothetical protein ACF3NR_09520 [Vaginella massiliensis]